MLVRSILLVLFIAHLPCLASEPSDLYEPDLKECPMSGDGKSWEDIPDAGKEQRNLLKRLFGERLAHYICSRSDHKALVIKRFFDRITYLALDNGIDAFKHLNRNDLLWIHNNTTDELTVTTNELNYKLGKIFDDVAGEYGALNTIDQIAS